MKGRLLRSRKKWVRVTLGCAVFTAGGVWAILQSERALGWVGTAFFGFGVVVGVANIIRPPSLSLDPKGFEASKLLGRPQRYEWSKCSQFQSWRVPTLFPRQRITVVTFDDDEPRDTWLRRANRRVAGVRDGLPDTYGLTTDELVDLLNEYRLRASRRNVSQTDK